VKLWPTKKWDLFWYADNHLSVIRNTNCCDTHHNYGIQQVSRVRVMVIKWGKLSVKFTAGSVSLSN